MTTSTLVAIIAAIVGAGGIFGGVATWRKVVPEKESIIITAAQGALVVQAGVLDELRVELQRAHGQIAELEKQVGKVNDELHQEIQRLQTERDSLRRENNALRKRVRDLESRISQIEQNGA